MICIILTMKWLIVHGDVGFFFFVIGVIILLQALRII